MMGGSTVEDFLKTYERLTDRWRAGHYTPEIRQRILGIVEDLREFGHL